MICQMISEGDEIVKRMIDHFEKNQNLLYGSARS